MLHSAVKSFGDGTKVTKAIKSDADYVLLQEDLNAVYQWSISTEIGRKKKIWSYFSTIFEKIGNIFSKKEISSIHFFFVLKCSVI